MSKSEARQPKLSAIMMANESGAIKLLVIIIHLICSISSQKLFITAYSIAVVNQTNNDLTNRTTTKPASTTIKPEMKLIRLDRSENLLLPQEQRLALQIVIADSKATNDIARKSPYSYDYHYNHHHHHRPHLATRRQQQQQQNFIEESTNTRSGFKRPYDPPPSPPPTTTLPQITSDGSRHFYFLDSSLLKDMSPNKNSVNPLYEKTKLKQEQQASKKMIQRSELIRTQHRPPWRRKQQASNQSSVDNLLRGSDMLLTQRNGIKKNRLRFTTLAPFLYNIPTTTEFFKLISSAHSPIKLLDKDSDDSDEIHIHKTIANKNKIITKERSTSTTRPIYEVSSINSNPDSIVSDGRVVSPEIQFDARNASDTIEHVVKVGNNSTRIINRNDSSALQSKTNSSHSDHKPTTNVPDPRSTLITLSHSDNNGDPNQIGSDEISMKIYNVNKRPVTIIRHSPKSTTRPPIVVIPEKIKIEEKPNNNHDLTRSKNPNSLMITTTTTTTNNYNPSSHQIGFNSNQPVRLISKQKHKYDDNVISPTITVVDNAAIRLPPNATSVHNNKLIVAIRPGRPHPRYPPTTQFPVYNIVAGIKPPYQTTPATVSFTRPPSIDGSVYGLLKPSSNNGSDLSTTPSPPSTFGAPNIKFPAPSPSSISTQLQQPPVELIDKLNISVPDNANIVGPNKVPDRIQMETSEQHFRPPQSVMISSDQLILRPSTTKKPTRQSTTKRINIVSANTTVVTTSADELHDVLSDVIAGSHHLSSNQNKPTSRPGLLASISNLFSAGVTTSAVAVLTLIKTIFMAILVMFLPPIALTAAIMQAVSFG